MVFAILIGAPAWTIENPLQATTFMCDKTLWLGLLAKQKVVSPSSLVFS